MLNPLFENTGSIGWTDKCLLIRPRNVMMKLHQTAEHRASRAPLLHVIADFDPFQVQDGT